MKKALIVFGVLAVAALATLAWLASSVGPDTAPTEIKSIELDIDAS